MSKRTTIIIIAAIVIAAAALRLPGIFTDFWLDEIWSLNIAKSVHSPADVVLSEAARIDNNHPLNTWYLYALGDVRHWWLYRLPALATGIASVIVVAHAMWRRSATEAIAAALIVALSFPLVFYSSEARGYGLAVFFALLAFDAMLHYDHRPGWSSAIVFNIACVLGFLAHLTFAHVYLAALYWTVLRARRTKRPIVQQLFWWARLNAVPLMFIIVLLRVFVRNMTIGGAEPADPWRVLVRTLSIALGGPDRTRLAIIFALFAAALFAAAIIYLFRQRDDLWFFYLLAVVVAPAFLLLYNLVLSQKPQPLMPRYFLVAVTMLLISIAHAARAFVRLGTPGVVIGLVLAIVFVYANTARAIGFIHEGRGGYTRAIARMTAVSPDAIVTVASDDNFRTGTVIDFYRTRIVPQGRTIDFFFTADSQTLNRSMPEWLIITDIPFFRTPDQLLSSGDGTIYRHNSHHSCYGLSGQTWTLYRIDLAETARRRSR